MDFYFPLFLYFYFIINTKYQNADDIISSIEEYESASGEMGSLIERQMYKYGLYDGLHLILDWLQKNVTVQCFFDKNPISRPFIHITKLFDVNKSTKKCPNCG